MILPKCNSPADSMLFDEGKDGFIFSEKKRGWKKVPHKEE